MAKKHTKLVSVPALARHWGVSRQAIYNLIYKGHIKALPPLSKHKKGGKWLIFWPQEYPIIKPGPRCSAKSQGESL